MTAQTFTSPRAEYQIGRILAALKVNPMTRAELCADLHLSVGAVCSYLGHLMSEPRRVRIAPYRPTQGRYSPVYALGSTADAIEPSRKTRTQYYRRLQRDKSRHELHLARRRADAAAKKAAKKPQTWCSALM
jgi:hypothetical protein